MHVPENEEAAIASSSTWTRRKPEIESWAIPLEPIVDGDAERALERLPCARGRTWIYRGWMLSEDEYAGLYDAVTERGETLLVDPEEFAEATYAPRYLPRLGEHTAPPRRLSRVQSFASPRAKIDAT